MTFRARDLSAGRSQGILGKILSKYLFSGPRKTKLSVVSFSRPDGSMTGLLCDGWSLNTSGFSRHFRRVEQGYAWATDSQGAMNDELIID
jgi:hypothetical protein